MANILQLALLKTGVKAWNWWREKSPTTRIDLSRVDLSNTNLSTVNFDSADLSDTFLSTADLSRANLTRENLRGAYLSNAKLLRTNLSWADISDGNLEESQLLLSDLIGTKLIGTRLGGANFVEAHLVEADLSEAILEGANFSESLLRNANFSRARCGRTTFREVDLSQVKGLETIEHWRPSSIDITTIYKSKGNIPEVFLRGCGVPENLITYFRSFSGEAYEFHSCFISHSAKDQRFCERLYADLQAKGVRVWLFEEDAKWGETVWGEIDRSIKVYDKLIVVCSENSLQSGPVNREIERALIREDKEGKGILFPIRIDDYIFDHWEHERKADVVRKVVGDFSGWDKDAAKYDKAFDKLLKGLQTA